MFCSSLSLCCDSLLRIGNIINKYCPDEVQLFICSHSLRKARNIQHQRGTAPVTPKTATDQIQPGLQAPGVLMSGFLASTWTLILRNCKSSPCRLYKFKSLISLMPLVISLYLRRVWNSCTNLLTKASFSCQPLIFSFLAPDFSFILTPKMQVICEILVIAASLFHGQGAWATGNLK